MTNRLQQLSRRDIERLSAYLDGELSSRQAARLEARLVQEPGLQAGLDELRQTSRLVAGLPQLRVPRSFALSPEMVGQQDRGWRYPIMQLATAVAAFAFLVVVGFDAVTSQGLLADNLVGRTAAEAPLAQEAAPEAMMESAEQAELDEAQPGEDFVEEAELSEGALAEALGSNEPQAEEEAMEAEVQGTPVPEGTEQAAVADQLEAEAEQERAIAPSVTPSASPELLPTELPASAELPIEPAGAMRTWLRWLEIGLAALVIVLAGLTIRLRPH